MRDPGSLTLGSSPFFYWNTKADGTGTIFGPGASTFPNQSTNLTLFAIWGVTTGLTNGGVTTHFNFFYDPSLGGAGGIEPARINQLLATGTGGKPVIENDFDWLQAQFAGVDMTKARSFPIPVQVTAVVEAGYNASWGWPLVMNAGKNASTLLRSMFISEVSEVFMAAQDKGWGYSNGVGDEESCGEALSLFLTVQFQISQGLGTNWLMNGTPSTWLNTSLPASNPSSTEFDSTGQFGGPSTGTHYGSRQDYIGSVKPFAGNGPATGCCMAFLYYLFHQLQFTSIPQIIAAAPGVDSSNNVNGGSCLKGVYKNLTGDDSDPFPYFASLLAAAYPPDQVASIPGPNVDDPWPLGSLSYVGAKDTWGRDEITDVINKGGTYPDGFLVALDGFSLNVLGGTRPSVPTIAFQGVTTALSATTPNIFRQSDNPNVPQQILFAYDVLFANPLGTFPATGETPAAVNTGITVLGKGLSATTEFFFTASATPYFTNVVPDPANPNNVNVPWLSEDLRLFTATPGASLAAQTPVPGGPQFVENTSGGGFDTAGAYKYIQALLIYLNQNFAKDGSIDPFAPASGVIPQQDRSARRRFLGDAVHDGQRSHPQQLQLRSCPCAPEGHRGDDERGERKGVLPLVGNSDCRHRLGSGCHLSESEGRRRQSDLAQGAGRRSHDSLLRDQPAAQFQRSQRSRIQDRRKYGHRREQPDHRHRDRRYPMGLFRLLSRRQRPRQRRQRHADLAGIPGNASLSRRGDRVCGHADPNRQRHRSDP